MSAEDKTSSEPSHEETVIDAEVVSETVVSNEQDHTKPLNEKPQPAKPSKTGWVVALILASFMAGLFAFPWFETGLVAVGLLPKPTSVIYENTNDQAAVLEEQSSAIAALEAKLAQYATAFDEQAFQFQENVRALEELRVRVNNNEPRNDNRRSKYTE